MTRPYRAGQEAPPRHDPGYRAIFSHRTRSKNCCEASSTGTGPNGSTFSTLERVSNSFVSADLRGRHSDLIWRIRLRGKEESWVYLYLLLEFRSISDSFMAVRLLTYVGLLLEDNIRKESLKPGDRLPAVFPLVLRSGRDRWRAPMPTG